MTDFPVHSVCRKRKYARLKPLDIIFGRSLLSLSEFPPQATLEILDKFAGPNMDSVRNKSAYLAGVMKRYKRDEPQDPTRGGPPYERPASIPANLSRDELLDYLAPVARRGALLFYKHNVRIAMQYSRDVVGFDCVRFVCGFLCF